MGMKVYAAINAVQSDLAREGITGGCATSPAQYCPDGTVTRGQMAVFLVRAFHLPL